MELRAVLVAAVSSLLLGASPRETPQSKGAEKIVRGKIEFIKVDSFGTEYKDALRDAPKLKKNIFIFFT